jgi:hypothetical protein
MFLFAIISASNGILLALAVFVSKFLTKISLFSFVLDASPNNGACESTNGGL